MHLAPAEAEREHWIPWKWSSRWLWAVLWVLGIEPRSLQEQPVLTLKHWAISGPKIYWFYFKYCFAFIVLSALFLVEHWTRIRIVGSTTKNFLRNLFKMIKGNLMCCAVVVFFFSPEIILSFDTSGLHFSEHSFTFQIKVPFIIKLGYKWYYGFPLWLGTLANAIMNSIY